MYNIISTLMYLTVFLFFQYSVVTFGRKLCDSCSPMKKEIQLLLMSLINISGLALCSPFHFSAFQSWVILLLLFYLEGRTMFGLSHLISSFMAIKVAFLGLSATLFFYSLVAIVTNLPLGYFGGSAVQSGYVRMMPILFSYVTCGVMILLYTKEKAMKPILHLLKALKHVKLQLITMLILMAYLLLQYALYLTPDNNFYAKLFGLGFSLYISLGFHYTFQYAVRISYLYHLNEENISLRQALHAFKNEEENLRESTNMDPLTGTYNRAAAESLLHRLEVEGRPAIICLIDLDGLKAVNDHLGHKKGDVYLMTVAEALKKSCLYEPETVFRYGGDEFLMILPEADENKVNTVLSLANRVIDIKQEETAFLMQISTGIGRYNGTGSIKDVVNEADARMYEMKARHKEKNPGLVR